MQKRVYIYIFVGIRGGGESTEMKKKKKESIRLTKNKQVLLKYYYLFSIHFEELWLLIGKTTARVSQYNLQELIVGSGGKEDIC